MNTEKEKENRPLGWTTLEEAKQLMEAGLDPNTADMYYEKTEEEPRWKSITGKDSAIAMNLFSYRNGYVVPCWSIGALIELFPTDYESNDDRCVNIARRMKSKYYPAGWQLYFIGPVDRKLHSVDESNLIEGVVKTMLLCLEHGLVKKGGAK